jgi:CDP-paratose 2-epimerase
LLEGDIRDPKEVCEAIQSADQVFHFAAQVAVTTSLTDPHEDFAVNAEGTLNVLESIRLSPRRPFLLFTSTNKVYGGLGTVSLASSATRHLPSDPPFRRSGISEAQPLDFCSPYGCSKGAADQYVLEYARSFDLSACVFRMSCIYGPHQHGTEDQGWVAHFMIRALEDEEITIYGDGRQVRDLLFVGDLVEAFLAAATHRSAVRGHAFNIGGGPGNAYSLLEMIQLIGKVAHRVPDVAFAEPRPSDQLYYVSDTRKFGRVTGWRPGVSVPEGVAHLHAWLQANRIRRVPAQHREAAG